MITKNVNIKQILNPTSIDLGDYVINPYKGCQYACIYCYVRFNKVIQKDPRPWGTYVDVRANAPQLLEKEILKKKPERVLLGSTTECFQPVEKKFGLTRHILEILNKHGIHFSVLTRSPLTLDYSDLLNTGFCENIYFTVNFYPEKFKKLLEPKTPPFEERIEAVLELIRRGVPAIPYCSPVLPYITNIKEIFERLGSSDEIGFEGLNFNCGNFSEVLEKIASVAPQVRNDYAAMRTNLVRYRTVWNSIRKTIEAQAKTKKAEHSLYLHKLHSYFENKYRR